MTNHSVPNRREILHAAAAVGAFAAMPVLAAAEPPPETRRIRLMRLPVDAPCVSPMWIAEELLRAEGFEDISYVPLTPVQGDPIPDTTAVGSGDVDMALVDVFSILLGLDANKPVLALAGIHPGCFELFGAKSLRSIRDLKGKTIVAADWGRRAFVSLMLAHVGLDPRKDVTLVESSEGVRLLSEGKVDAMLGFPPEPQIMRAKKIGVSLVNMSIDRPWSLYFCCMVLGNRNFVARNPVATKRALRALLKAADLCAAEPERTARTMVDRGFYKDYVTSVQALREVSFKRWREFDSAESLRFYALRMHEAGILKSAPQKLLRQGTDWRFIEQLRRELKA